MEFFLELLLTAVVALLFSFLVAKLVSVSMADRSSDQAERTEIGVGDGLVTVEELRFGLKMDAPVIQRKRKDRVVVDENVEHVDRFGSEADGVVVDEVEEADEEVELVVTTSEADEFLAAVLPENVIGKEKIVRGEDKRREETSGEVGDDREELIVSTVEAEYTASVIAEEIMNRRQEERSEPTEERTACAENVTRVEVEVTESEEVKVEESKCVEKSDDKMELSTEEEKEEQEELNIEDDDDDDWEGIERSELEKAFVAASNLLEESGKGEEIGGEAKMELYGLHKIATEGSCREAQPMAVMLSARAKWNAWQKLGNMSQEEAMEQYLALVSKEIPGLVNTVGKMPETENSVILPPNSGSLEEPTTLDNA
ncbi:unnamed protein product [Eruca vesicaria subsp. sativa]|uniref:ACB domain-containing protein n=1 Tax=Eruca vesicaria subsp. sativa TaxID=29727 RepID=A0ABC8LH76_ERUVS|nr:unnamed protein product [Eruca vesicaria subsp. sativa]